MHILLFGNYKGFGSLFLYRLKIGFMPRFHVIEIIQLIEKFAKRFPKLKRNVPIIKGYIANFTNGHEFTFIDGCTSPEHES